MQDTQRLEERLGRPGMPFDAYPLDAITRIAEVAIRPGDVAIRGSGADTDGDGAKALVASSPAAAADTDAIMVAEALAAGAESNSGAALDGVVGATVMLPARNITLTLNSHADWDVSVLADLATYIAVIGEDAYGRSQTEYFPVKDAGNVTYTGVKLFSKVISVDTPAGSGTNRTLDAGVGTLFGGLSSKNVLGIVRYLAARQFVQGATTEFAVGDVLSIITEGPVWVEVEEDVLDGEQVYVRLIATGGESIGGFRNDRDGTAAAPDAVPIIGWRYRGDSINRDSVRMAVIDVVKSGAA